MKEQQAVEPATNTQDPATSRPASEAEALTDADLAAVAGGASRKVAPGAPAAPAPVM